MGETQWATIEEISYLFGWSTSYVRKLASRDQWRRVGYAPRVYNLIDVGRSQQFDKTTETGTE